VDAAVELIKERLRKKAPWIIRQLSFFLTFQPRQTDRKYIGGETHLYLGKQYRLKVISYELGVVCGDSVKLKGQFLETVESIIGEKVDIPQKLQEFMKGEKQSIPMTKDFESFKAYLMEI
jgi:predicted metal-dependent hydrolase